MKKLFILLSIILFCQGCTSTPEIKVIVSSDQKSSYDEAVISQKKHLVSLSPYTDFKVNKYIENKTIFNLIIQNCGEKPIFANYDNVSVIFEENGNDRGSKQIKLDSLQGLTGYKIRPMRSNTYNMMASVSEAHKDYLQDQEDRIKHELRVLYTVLPKIILKSHTIIPDEAISVIFFCDTMELGPKTEGHFKIDIMVDGEKHEFMFMRSIEL